MSDDNKNYKINRIDFGLKINNPESNSQNSNLFSSNANPKKISFAEILKSFSNTFSYIKILFKRLLSSIGKLKWVLSRSIFLGRGVYFKYVSSFALLVSISFGFFVYLGYNYSQNGDPVISKYSNVSALGSSVLFTSGSQTSLSQKQYRITQYTVKSGDTLSSIASQYSTTDNTINVDTIMWANGLRVTDTLKPGMVLDIPPVSGVLHTIRKGETLASIAKKYKLLTDKSSPEDTTGVTQAIMDTNNIDIKVVQSADGEITVPDLVEGNRIIIPGGVIVLEAPKVQATKTPTASSNVPINIPTGQQFVWPIYGGVGIVTGCFRCYPRTWHDAVDIAYGRDKIGPFLVAMADGYVRSAKWEDGGGAYVVRIDYDNGFKSLYAHMSQFDQPMVDALNKGQHPRVLQGQVVGRLGSTGNSTGPHVHVELNYKGTNLDACLYLKCTK